jgi:hypothetical protein
VAGTASARDRRCIVDGVIATATPEPDTVRGLVAAANGALRRRSPRAHRIA